MQALDDLIVQTEIFLQYSLQAKAMERLQKIAAMFPGEEERNARLQNLVSDGQLVAETAASKHEQPREGSAGAGRWKLSQLRLRAAQASYTADTLRDLTKISEINQKIFRQQTPRAMLNTTVSEVGAYLKAGQNAGGDRCAGPSAGNGCRILRAGLKPAPGAQVVFLLAQMEKAMPDELGGLVVDASEGSILGRSGVGHGAGSDDHRQGNARRPREC